MKHFAVIGNPVKHSLSPALHNWVFKSLNIQAIYKKISVEEEVLPDIIQQMKNGILDGFNITIPHKENIMKFVDEINPRALCIGSVNCLIKSNSKIITREAPATKCQCSIHDIKQYNGHLSN